MARFWHLLAVGATCRARESNSGRPAAKWTHATPGRGRVVSRTREKAHGRRDDGGSFVLIPHRVLESTNFVSLSAHASRLLLDMCVQYKGKNNGDLCVAWSTMRLRGWRSRDTLFKAIRELEAYGMIERTRQGGEGKAGRRAATLFALTWLDVDECGGKLDIGPKVRSGKWRLPPDLQLLAGKTRTPTRPASSFNTPGVSRSDNHANSNPLQHAPRVDSGKPIHRFNTPGVLLSISTKGGSVSSGRQLPSRSDRAPRPSLVDLIAEAATFSLATNNGAPA